MRRAFLLAALGVAALSAGCATWYSWTRSPGFFVTSANPGRGADFGGLAGADAHCQALATAVGAGGHTWHA